MKTPIELRPMQEEDLTAVLRIQAQCYSAIQPESEAAFLAKLHASPHTSVVALHQGQIQGYLVAVPACCFSWPQLNTPVYELPEQPDCLYLHDLAVAPQARALGLGKRLVYHFLTQLHALGWPYASLIAIQNSAPYWEGYGFQAAAMTDSQKAKLDSYGAGAQYMLLTRSDSE